MKDAQAIAALILCVAIGVLVFGLITHAVLAGLFGLSVSFGQSVGIGLILGFLLGAVSK